MSQASNASNLNYLHHSETDPFCHVLATALAVGCNNAEIHSKSDRHRYTNDPHRHYTTITTTISLDFFQIHEPSPFLPESGQSREDAIRALLAGSWPLNIFHGDPNTGRARSPITVSSGPNSDHGATRSNSPAPSFGSNGSLTSVTFADPDSAAAAAILTNAAPAPTNLGTVGITPEASQRWYSVTVGRKVGVIQGANAVRSLVSGVPNGSAVRYHCREAAEAAFANALLVPEGVRVVDQ